MKKILITGTSCGLGKALVKLLATRNQNAIIYATSRGNIHQASINWQKQFPQAKIHCKLLQITDPNSIDQFQEEMNRQNIRIDILVNNAGIAGHQQPTASEAKHVLATNFHGQINLTQKLLPYLTDNGRVINVSSRLGALRLHSEDMQARLRNEDIELSELQAIANNYIQQVEKGTQHQIPYQNYIISKTLLNCWSRFILQKRLLSNHQLALCMSPGPCKTRMGLKDATYTPEQGAEAIYQCIWLKQPKPHIFYSRTEQSTYEECGNWK